MEYDERITVECINKEIEEQKEQEQRELEEKQRDIQERRRRKNFRLYGFDIDKPLIDDGSSKEEMDDFCKEMEI